MAADLAAAINPLLRPTARVIAHAVERWADEDAADAVGDRRLVARTLARTALLQHRPISGGAVAATGGDVVNRVRALLAPTPTRHPSALAVLLVLLLTTAVAAGAVQRTG
jgi:hypothetical protein